MTSVSEFESWMSKPLGLHPDSTIEQSGALIIAAEDVTWMLRWCCRNHCGAIWHCATNRWTLLTPISFSDFLEYLDDQNIFPVEFRDSWDARRWIKFHMLADTTTPDR